MEFSKIDFSVIPSPSYVIDLDILRENLGLVKERAKLLDIKPLLSIKGFPLALIYQNIAHYLCGTSASSLFEAQLGRHMGKENHVHAPAYKDDEFQEIIKYCDHIVFNSMSQWEHFKGRIFACNRKISSGLRINPEYTEIEVDKYNPCLPFSRFGMTRSKISANRLLGIDGFHIHAMCDQGADTLVHVIGAIIEKFGDILPRMSWINLGGGHQLASPNYDVELLKKSLPLLTETFGLTVYVEPCEAIVTGCGYFVSTVLDVVENGKNTAILDASALCHMPDVLEMPYKPDIATPANGSGDYSYILAGASCLSGDIIGEYLFCEPLKTGDKIIFLDMGAYTFAKENHFNGINYPAIILYDKKEGPQIVKQFTYRDYEFKYY